MPTTLAEFVRACLRYWRIWILSLLILGILVAAVLIKRMENDLLALIAKREKVAAVSYTRPASTSTVNYDDVSHATKGDIVTTSVDHVTFVFIGDKKYLYIKEDKTGVEIFVPQEKAKLE